MSDGELKIAWNRKEKKTYRIKEQIKFAKKKLTIEHLFYTISIATNKRTFFKRLWISGHPSSGCDEIRNEFIKAMGYSCQWILSAFGTNDHQHEEVSCIMTSKNRSSMVKDTKAKGYKIVSLVWYILLCALCNHTESRIATDQLDCLATCLSENCLLLKIISEYVGQTAVNVYLWLPFLFGVHPVLLASTCRHLLQYWIIWMRSGLYRPTGLLFISQSGTSCSSSFHISNWSCCIDLSWNENSKCANEISGCSKCYFFYKSSHENEIIGLILGCAT